MTALLQLGEREIAGGLEAAADAAATVRPPVCHYTPPWELPYERRPPRISRSPRSTRMNQRREPSPQFFLGTRLGALVVLVSLHAAVAASPQVQTPWQLVPPSGRDPIGTVTLHLIDRLRWDPIARTRRRRQLMVQLWYPVSPARTAGGAQYVEAGVARVLDRELSVPPGTFEAVRTLARVGAAVASASRPFPVVVYSPGHGSWRNASTALVEELVSHGFIVVTIDHPYDGEAVEFPDGTIALAQPLRQPNPALPIRSRSGTRRSSRA